MKDTADHNRGSAPFETDPELCEFLQMMRSERDASVHTLNAYRRDIVQFARVIWEQGGKRRQPDWGTVTLGTARRYVYVLQDRELSRSTILRKLSSLRSFYRFLLR